MRLRGFGRVIATLAAVAASIAWVSPASAATVPTAPTGVQVAKGDGTLTFTWSPPTSDGDSPLTGYALFRPWEATPFVTLEPDVVEFEQQLPNTDCFDLQVAAVNSQGTGARSEPVVGCPSGPMLVPVAPARLLDTRKGIGSPATPFGPVETRSLAVHGVAGIPSTATSVVLNVTLTDASAATHLTVWPDGEAKPASSTVNTASGDTSANIAMIGIGPGGGLEISNHAGEADVIVDVTGYFDPTAPLAGFSFSPGSIRLVDTRVGYDTHHGTDGPGALAGGEVRNIDLGGTNGIPADTPAALVNITAVGASADTHLTVWAGAGAKPATSTLNLRATETRANVAVVPLAADGSIDVANHAGDVHLVVDLIGIFEVGRQRGSFRALAPLRVIDTRNGTGTDPIPLGPREARNIDLRTVDGVPGDWLVANVTVTDATVATHLSALPSWSPGPGAPLPKTSTVNTVPGRTQAAFASFPPNSWFFNNAGYLTLVADVTGYWSND